MIAVRLMGGLGNQLFQFAAGFRLAARHGSELTLDLGWFGHEGRGARSPRSFELDALGLSARRIEVLPAVLSRWEAVPRRRFPRRKGLQVIRQRELDFRVDERVLNAPDDVLLLGYWQSERYFSDVAEVVQSELHLPDRATDEYLRFEELARRPDAVAVHVRRGDYVSDAATNAFHGTLGPDYYRRAVVHVAERAPGGTFLAFSDDPEWVERELAADLSLTVVVGSDAIQELRLMSLCHHHVIANSSFSWWGAWLGEREGSIVVAPQRWFADPSIDTRSMAPPRWLRL